MDLFYGIPRLFWHSNLISVSHLLVQVSPTQPIKLLEPFLTPWAATLNPDSLLSGLIWITLAWFNFFFLLLLSCTFNIHIFSRFLSIYIRKFLQFFSCVVHLSVINTLTLPFWVAYWYMNLVIGLSGKRDGRGVSCRQSLRGGHYSFLQAKPS